MEEVYKSIKLGYTAWTMISDLLYRCPSCGGFEWLDHDRCVSCHAQVSLVSRSHLSINGDTRPISYWYHKTLAFDLPPAVSGVLLKSGRVRLAREAQQGLYKGFSGITAIHFTRAPVDTGTLSLKEDSLCFSGLTGPLDIPFQRLTSLTIESNTLIVISRDHGPLFFDFLEESGKKWEDCIQKALRRFHQPESITEFYPRVRLEKARRERPAPAAGHRQLTARVQRWFPHDRSLFFAAVRAIARPLIRRLFPVKISGLENIPPHGPAVIVPNHASFLDSLILGVMPKRFIWYMAKNSEYRHPVLKWCLRLANTFPVRRYTIDVLGIRNAIRVVQAGHLLGIFPEGERTWDGELLPFRQGLIRLILALGVPVVPVGITGAYELMPRWTSSIRLSPVTISIGEPLRFAHIPAPKQTSEDIEAASTLLRSELMRLKGDRP